MFKTFFKLLPSVLRLPDYNNVNGLAHKRHIDREHRIAISLVKRPLLRLLPACGSQTMDAVGLAVAEGDQGGTGP